MSEAANQVIPLRTQADKRSLMFHQIHRVMELNRLYFTRFGSPGTQFEGARDLYAVLGYPPNISIEMLEAEYARGGIAKRVVDSYPDACWGNPPDVYFDPSKTHGRAQFDEAIEALDEEHDIWAQMRVLDRLARKGRYGVLYLGIPGRPEDAAQPVKGPDALKYISCYSESTCRIQSFDTDPGSPRFGLPLMYEVSLDPEERSKFDTVGSMDSTIKPQGTFRFHWSRAIHVIPEENESKVYGVPALQPIYNYLQDLHKIVGGGAETYWLAGNRGMAFNVDKDMNLHPDDEAALSDEIDEYMHGLRRALRLKGVEAKDLGSDVADPSGAFETVITLLAGTTGIPRRILTGSESGALASSQDKASWAERVGEYRINHANPHVLKPALRRFAELGILPKTKAGEIKIDWPDAYYMSPLERSQASAQVSRAATNIARTCKDMPGLLGVSEARRVLGQSTNEQIFDKDAETLPDPKATQKALAPEPKGTGRITPGSKLPKADPASPDPANPTKEPKATTGNDE